VIATAKRRLALWSRDVNLIDRLHETASTSFHINFLDDGEEVQFSQLWDDAGRVSAWLRAHCETPAVGTVLDNSRGSVTCLLGAWRAGLRVISLPAPPRGRGIGWYPAYLADVCSHADVGLVVLDATYVSSMPSALGIEIFSHAHILDAAGTWAQLDLAGGRLVQFTSGSTSDPKGVELSLDQVLANIEAILAVVEPTPRDVPVSWLPLSHDMGLIGMLLASIVAGGPSRMNGGKVVLLRPEKFMLRPMRWLQACSEFGGTFTAAPNFAFQTTLAAAAKARGPMDLTQLRVCITGAEPVKCTTLERFADRFANFGFDSRSFCPAYGLAELALAVTMVPPAEHWRSIAASARHLDLDSVEPIEGGRCLVSSGSVLPGYAVQIGGESDVGPISVDGPSLFRGYLGESRRDGPFLTGDVGFVRDGHLYVIGRADDVAVIGGRKIWLADADAAIEGTGLVRPGRGATVYSPDTGLVAVVELAPSARSSRVVQEIASAIALRTGARPTSVVSIEKGALPRTTSGKPKRSEIFRTIVRDSPSILEGADTGHKERP